MLIANGDQMILYCQILQNELSLKPILIKVSLTFKGADYSTKFMCGNRKYFFE